MDVILAVADHVVLDRLWARLVPLPQQTGVDYNASHFSAWPRDYIVRQVLSVTTLTIIGIVVLYLLFASVSYYFIFDHRMMRHPRFLKNQVKLEIMCSLWSFPGMTLLTLPWFMGEVRGYSRLYTNVKDYGWTYLFLSIPLFVCVRSQQLFRPLTNLFAPLEVSSCSRIIVFTGSTDGCTFHFCINTFTNPTTNGSYQLLSLVMHSTQ